MNLNFFLSISSYQSFYENKLSYYILPKRFDVNSAIYNEIIYFSSLHVNFCDFFFDCWLGGWAFRKVHGLLWYCSSKRWITGSSQLYLTEDSINNHSSRRPLARGCNWWKSCSSVHLAKRLFLFIIYSCSWSFSSVLLKYFQICWIHQLEVPISPPLSTHSSLYFLTDFKKFLVTFVA